jgi:Ca2+-binding RTX toxin-like protein
MKKIPVRILLVGLALLLLASILTALAASNSVDPSRVGSTNQAVSYNQLRPVHCTMNIQNVITGSGTITGTNQNDLILGSSGADSINGRQGLDCILGGGGDDTLNGFVGNGDVCIGGPGTDTFASCETIVQEN